jgi:hypothetical protein
MRPYDLWKSDVGPWPSVGDDERPTNPRRRRSFWGDAVIDLTGDAAEPMPAPNADDVLDLVDDILDLTDDVDDHTA